MIVESFIKNVGERIDTEVRWGERQRVNNSVVLRKRYINGSDNDRLGIFSPLTGGWTANLNTQGIYSLNITTPTIRTNASALATANVKIDIETRFPKDTTSQMAADVATAFTEQWAREQWTNMFEQFIAIEQQLGPGVFVRTIHNPNIKRKHALPKWEDTEVEMPGSAVCGECGEESPVSGELDEIVACGVCGGIAVIDKMPENVSVPVPTGFAEFTTGQIETYPIPFFEMRMDARAAGGLKKARWIEHHYLTSLNELQIEYRESADAIKGATYVPSYPLQWQETLAKGRVIPADDAQSVVEQREVRDIFLTPAMYLNEKVEQDFVLGSGEQVRFAVKKDQTLADAVFEGEPFKEAPVLCFRLVGSNLIDIFPCDFREEFQYITFLANPSSPWGLFFTDLQVMQDIVNQMLTLQMYHIKRNAITSIVYNASSFDPEAFSKDLIPTKDTIPPDIPIKDTYDIIPALRMSGEPMEMLNTVMTWKADVTLTTPALMGQAQPNEPYHAQLLQKQSALGLLSPAGMSKAAAKVGGAIQQLKLRQSYFTEEDGEELLKLNAEWTEDWVNAFLECDLENDLIITYREGTELPTSLIEREVKLQNMLSQIMSLGQIDPSILQPQLVGDLLTQLINTSGLEIDFDNNESNLRLAQVRYDRLLKTVSTAPPTNDPNVLGALAQQIVMQPEFHPLPFENYAVMIEFYGDKQRGEAARDEPNYLLIGCLSALIQMEQMAQTGQAQVAATQQLQAQAPMLQAQQQQEAQKEGAISQREETNKQAEDTRTQAQFDENQRQRDHDTLHKTLDLQDRHIERQQNVGR